MSLSVKVKTGSKYLKTDFAVLRRIYLRCFFIIPFYNDQKANDGEFEAKEGGSNAVLGVKHRKNTKRKSSKRRNRTLIIHTHRGKAQLVKTTLFNFYLQPFVLCT